MRRHAVHLRASSTWALAFALLRAFVGCTEPTPAPTDAARADADDAALDAKPADAPADAPAHDHADVPDAASPDVAADRAALDASRDADASDATDASRDLVDARFVYADLAPFTPDDIPPGYDVNFDRSWDALSVDLGFRLVDVSGLSADAGPPDGGPPPCTPGTIEACACPDGRSGYQTCEYDFTYSRCACAEPPPVLTTPRLIAPLSGMRVTSQRPTLRWMLPAGVTRARVELCADRPCTRMLAQQQVTGASWRPPTRLEPGLVFWRVRGLDAAGAVAWTSATWLFQVRRRDAEVDTTVGRIRDFNGDGYDDILLGRSGARPTFEGDVYFGTPSGLTPEPLLSLPHPEDRAGLGASSTLHADLNGDGITDLAIVYWRRDSSGPVLVDTHLGDRAAPILRRAGRSLVPINVRRVGDYVEAADLNGDGVSELVFDEDMVYLGSELGPAAEPSYVYAEHVDGPLPRGRTTGQDFRGCLIGFARNSSQLLA